MTVRIGQGFDVHPFSTDSGRRLVLAGVVIEGAPGLQGHSDADVVCHALANAVLGATGLGDLGSLFPATDPQWEGAESTAMLAEVVFRTRAAGYTVVNGDCTVLAERPQLSHHIPQMAERMSGILRGHVSVKATRGEGLGAIGRAEGIACLSVVLLENAR